jgi:hypothetical protein
MAWPPRSPDLTHGVHKDLVYQTGVQDVAELQLVRLLHQGCCRTLGERQSGVWTFVGPPRAHTRRSAEDHQNLENFCIFQRSSHVSVYISLEKITFCYWQKFPRTLCIYLIIRYARNAFRFTLRPRPQCVHCPRHGVVACLTRIKRAVRAAMYLWVL